METENSIGKKALKIQRRIWQFIASLLLVLGLGNYFYLNNYNDKKSELGTYNDPEVAFREIQKTLSVLSINLNTGIESVKYIKEYNNSKNLIFKEQK